ncbi:hypothetical protein N8546_01210 [bacterium]|jgi:hypothetical protein|nr:hypothetical protein [bacterium]MDB4808115.1 hypothetical protein [Verrucomicrobiota bacterium]
MSHLPDCLIYKGTELENTLCCWKCKELNPETREKEVYSENGSYIVLKCSSCGGRVGTAAGWETLAKQSKLSFVGFTLLSAIVIPFVYFLVENHEDKVGIIGIAALFPLVCAGLWVYVKLGCSRRRSILKEIDRFPKPKTPTKRQSKLPPKIEKLPPKLNKPPPPLERP